MIHKFPPKDFRPWFEIVSCYCMVGDQFLLLKRNEEKSEGGKWGLPAGKKDKSETLLEAMVREIKEETGLNILATDMKFLQTGYVRYPDKDFLYHTFMLILRDKPEISLATQEHQEHTWVTPIQALDMNLIQDEDQSIQMTFKL